MDMNINIIGLPPTLDSPPKFCFCGERTVESHDFWFCSISCARLDSLRSLGDPNSHYRNVVRGVNEWEGASQRQPRRMSSAFHLRPGPSEQWGHLNAPVPLLRPQQANFFTPGPTQGQTMPRFPTLSQVASKVLTRKASKGESPVAGNNGQQRWEGLPTASSRLHSVQKSNEQISLDAIPLPGPVPTRTLRRVPTIDSLRSTTRKNSITSLLQVGRSRKTREQEMVFGHVVDPSGIVPPIRKDSLPSSRQVDTPPLVPPKTSQALRRSVSFAGCKVPQTRGRNPLEHPDVLMHMIEEMREELVESFDPRSLFDHDDY